MKSGFTLAEVLVTLVIIGIVASMTLPALITKSRNSGLEAGLKKNYSVILQALNSYQAEHGERITSNIKGATLKAEIMPYFNVARDCGQGNNEKDCVPFLRNNPKSSNLYKTFSGKPLTELNMFDDGQFVLLDGSLIMLENAAPIYNNSRVFITVDVNGFNKRPNRWGFDLFTFQLDKEGKLLPMGVSGTAYTNSTYCSMSSSSLYNGISCTSRALNEKNYFNNLP